MKVGAQVKGLKKLRKSLQTSTEKKKQRYELALAGSVTDLHSTIIKKIQAKSAGEFQYRVNKGGSNPRTVQASKPGDPPNTDQGFLVDSYNFKINKRKLLGSVSSDLPYATYLEYGTKNMRERPHVRPSINENIKNIQERFRKAHKSK